MCSKLYETYMKTSTKDELVPFTNDMILEDLRNFVYPEVIEETGTSETRGATHLSHLVSTRRSEPAAQM